MLRRVSNALLAAIVLAIPLVAQRGGGLPTLAPTTSRAGLRSFHPSEGQQTHGSRRTVFLGTPLWADDFAPSNPETPPVIVVQTPLAQKSVDQDAPKPLPPLVIELQGDRYVRRTDTANGPLAQRDSVAEAKLAGGASTRNSSAQPHIEVPPTLFVFRDGHREESSDYSIVTGVIYTRGQYWTNGYWSKQISLSQLDLPATFKANQERGVNFRLPGAANEVVTRP